MLLLVILLHYYIYLCTLQAEDRIFLVSMSYKEIYQEDVRDLLSDQRNMKIREVVSDTRYVT